MVVIKSFAFAFKVPRLTSPISLTFNLLTASILCICSVNGVCQFCRSTCHSRIWSRGSNGNFVYRSWLCYCLRFLSLFLCCNYLFFVARPSACVVRGFSHTSILSCRCPSGCLCSLDVGLCAAPLVSASSSNMVCAEREVWCVVSRFVHSTFFYSSFPSTLPVPLALLYPLLSTYALLMTLFICSIMWTLPIAWRTTRIFNNLQNFPHRRPVAFLLFANLFICLVYYSSLLSPCPFSRFPS